MSKEIGGYLPLELDIKSELYTESESLNIVRLNSGRAAITIAAQAVKPKRLYIPYYNCNSVREFLSKHNIAYELYYLDRDLEPKIDAIGRDDWILYVNYYGVLSEKKITKVVKKYRNVIIDNTQAFFSRPILDDNCFNVYSPRKFVGVSDGGYLVWSGDRRVNVDFPFDHSWERAGYLLKSIEMGTNSAYRDFLESEENLKCDIKRMSPLTQRILQSVDYEKVRNRRERNFDYLRNELDSINGIDISFESTAPFVYPLLIKNARIRERLVKRKIYVPQWWKYLLEEVSRVSIEYELSNYLIPLPIDQRYSECEMRDMVKVVFDIYREEVST